MIVKLLKYLLDEKWLREIPEEQLENKHAMRIHRFIRTRLKQEGIETKLSNYYHLTMDSDGRLYLRFHIPDYYNFIFIYEMTWDGSDSVTINNNTTKLSEMQKNIFGIIQKEAKALQLSHQNQRKLAKVTAIYHDVISLLITIYNETAWRIGGNEEHQLSSLNDVLAVRSQQESHALYHEYLKNRGALMSQHYLDKKD